MIAMVSGAPMAWALTPANSAPAGEKPTLINIDAHHPPHQGIGHDELKHRHVRGVVENLAPAYYYEGGQRGRKCRGAREERQGDPQRGHGTQQDVALPSNGSARTELMTLRSTDEPVRSYITKPRVTC